MGNIFGGPRPKTTFQGYHDQGYVHPTYNYRRSTPLYAEPRTDGLDVKRSHPETTRNEKASRATTDLLANQFSTAVSLNTNVNEKKTLKRQLGSDCEAFLLSILSWDPAWLSQEQKKFCTPPFVVNPNSISEIPLKFKCHENYCKIMETLLALEFWDGILREVETKETENLTRVKKKMQAPIPCSSLSYCSTKNTTSLPCVRRGTVTLEGVVSQKDFNMQNYPGLGDLVLIEQQPILGRAKALRIFAYVEEMSPTKITGLTRYNRNLSRYVREPHTLLTYSVVVKSSNSHQYHFGTDQIYTIQKIFYLRSDLRKIEALHNLPNSPLVRHILHPKFEDLKLSNIPSSKPRSLVTQDELNLRQMEAVIHVTDTAVRGLSKICLIQGPPGTGKSKVIVNLVTEILYGEGRFNNNPKMRILVCAPSNTAVDEIVGRLLHVRKKIPEPQFKMIRMGHTESMNSHVAREVSLKALVKKLLHSETQEYDDYEEKKRSLIGEINRIEEAQKQGDNNDKVDRFKTILEGKHAELDFVVQRLRAISKEIAERRSRAEASVLKEANVIACTLNSCYTNLMESNFGPETKESASICIVDEATQCIEAECLIPLMVGVRTLVLVGDTNQLPATVISQKAKQFGLDQSLFARIQNCFPTKEENPVIQLDTQYRMSPPVALWPNRFFYDGSLVNSAIVENLPFHYYKVLDHNATQNRDKFSNTDEAAFVVNLLYTLMTSSQLSEAKTPVTVGIITPYNNQKALIHKQIRECIHPLPENIKSKMVYEVNTVDSFQGQERDIIIMSCVRSNGIGFLSDRHRLCVALTRAKHSVILCGNFKTFERNSMWRALLSDAKTRGVYLKTEATARPVEIKRHVLFR